MQHPICVLNLLQKARSPKKCKERWSNYPICFLGWFVFQFTEDGVYSDPLQHSKLENEEGEDGHDVTFKIGDSCKAPRRDGGLYDGKVVFEGGKIINTCIYIELLFWHFLNFPFVHTDW